MAKRKAKPSGRKPAPKTVAKSGRRPKPRQKTKQAAKRAVKRAVGARKSRRPRTAASSAPTKRAKAKKVGRTPATTREARSKAHRLDRARRQLEDTVPTPPSSLDLQRRGTSARSGRRGLASTLDEHAGMTGLTGGDVDADFENAYFSGDEAPGGDNPTPDQDIVDDIGRSIGVEYQDNEELKSSDKVTERDKHRWELDPASSEDYKDRE